MSCTSHLRSYGSLLVVLTSLGRLICHVVHCTLAQQILQSGHRVTRVTQYKLGRPRAAVHAVHAVYIGLDVLS